MIRCDKLRSIWIAALAVLVCTVLAGCGDIFADETGRVVDPEKVPAAMRGTGLHTVLRPGPTPDDFAAAIYGTATNSRGRSINFGFFFSEYTRAQVDNGPELKRLVPDATDEGSTAGESYVEVTSAGAGSKDKPTSRRASEQQIIAEELLSAVAKLAPKALREEGP